MNRLTYEDMKKATPQNKILLDSNHSHFIFTDDSNDGGKSSFGSETRLRAEFEACVAANYPPYHVVNVQTGEKGVIRPYQSGAPQRAMEEYILDALRKENLGWDQMSLKKPSPKVDFSGIPAISICVQGGPGSVKTVLDAVSNDIPCLLVKGSGQAADLLADCVMSRFSPEHEQGVEPVARTHNVKRLMVFFTEFCGLKTGERSDDGLEKDHIIRQPDSDDHGCFHLSVVRQKLRSVATMRQDDASCAALAQALKDKDNAYLQNAVEWLENYAERAAKMQRNFYGQTKKERMHLKDLVCVCVCVCVHAMRISRHRA